jgi:NAD-dependent SIR2 family protein deacetylase
MRTRPMLDGPALNASAAAIGELDDVEDILAGGGVAVLSGAGLSTESGIPDYRGVTGTLRRHTPMTYQEFVGSADSRRRYWARSHLGWRTITRARPNAGHYAIASLATAGYVSAVITQNVDGLHRAAGSADAVELHGSLDRVRCLDCGHTSRRERLDRRLREANPGFEDAGARLNPDGDVELAVGLEASFRVVACEACGFGTLKPDVVFFGENVPKPRVEACFSLVSSSSALVVLGSSLTVMSGLRYVRRASSLGIPVVIVNQGATRGDSLATATLDAPLGAALTALVRELGLAGSSQEGSLTQA